MWRKENITLSSKILISHFTGVQKIITLCFTILMLSSINIINISALSYQNEVGIGFTFNPTLSVSLSSSDLIISNLTPDSSGNSNSINVSVATNAAYGYTLFATVGDNTHNNSNLTHSNNTNIFSSVATDADLAILTTDNTWGYSTSLDNGSSWSNYNGLSSSTSTTLIDNSNTADSTSNIDFKIGAKASSTQASGTYTNTINFIAVSKVAPMSLLDSFIASGAEQLNGYYKMQDMTHDICNNVDIEESELQLIDVRDNKVYWVAKLKDGNCWMTQNLDLDLDSNRTYTHWDTDLGWDTENDNTVNENITWMPANSTIIFTGTKMDGWIDSDMEPYSADPGDIYLYTSNSEANDIQYNSSQDCTNAGHNDCMHYRNGNYYNWTAIIADNNSDNITSGNAPNSICPRGWRIPQNNNKKYEVMELLLDQTIIKQNQYNQYTENGFNRIRSAPLYFIRSGYIKNNTLQGKSQNGFYWQNTITNSLAIPYSFVFRVTSIATNRADYYRSTGFPVRCVTR